MSAAQEAERLRLDDQEWADDTGRFPDGGDTGAPTLLVRVTSASGKPNSFFTCVPANVTGPETDGASATFTDGTGSLFACNVGKTAPAVGTFLLITFVGRWITRYD